MEPARGEIIAVLESKARALGACVELSQGFEKSACWSARLPLGGELQAVGLLLLEDRAVPCRELIQGNPVAGAEFVDGKGPKVASDRVQNASSNSPGAGGKIAHRSLFTLGAAPAPQRIGCGDRNGFSPSLR